MQVLLIYLLKVMACSGLLIAYYWFVLRDKQFHQYNRFYLLFVAVASILLPLIQAEWLVQSSNPTAVKWMQVIYTRELVVAAPSQTSWPLLFLLLFSTISLVLLIIQGWRIYQLFRLKKSYPCRHMPQQLVLINTDLPQAPFTFLNWLFWRNDLDNDSHTGRKIWMHELTHIQQKHTWDKLALQLVLCFYWMNPFFWILQKELYMVHEFIADAKAIEDKDSRAFATMLLQSTYNRFPFFPAQPFFYSPIKRRLAMFTTSQQPRYSYMRRLMVLPVTGIVLLLFAFRVKESQRNIPEAQVKQTVAEDTTRKKKAPDHVTFTAEKVVVYKKQTGDKIDSLLKDSSSIRVTASGNANMYDGTDSVVLTGKNITIQTNNTRPAPLYLIDDKVVTTEEVGKFPADEIASINVLKDAAATSVYGPKAKNGVVCIYTKSYKKP